MMSPRLEVMMLVSTSPATYSEIDSGEEKRLRKLRDQTSYRKAVPTPCMTRSQKSQRRTAPKSVGTKFTPLPLTVLRYRVMKPHRTMSMVTQTTEPNSRTGLPRSRKNWRSAMAAIGRAFIEPPPEQLPTDRGRPAARVPLG